MIKVVRFYIKFENGTEFSSKNFNVDYNDVEQLLVVLEDIYSIVSPYKAVEDIYINDPIYDINGDLQEEIPLASYFELVKPGHVIRYEIPSLGLKTLNFLYVVDACIKEPALVKYGGIIRADTIGTTEVGVAADIDIYAANWITVKYGSLTVDYSIQDIDDLCGILK